MHDSISISRVHFKTYKNDPIGVKEYTLDNGLKLLLSVNTDEPRIYTEIAVRVGSKHDPADTTGLAHYFEHMMFKGTDRLGSLDWEQEKPLLDQIEKLFEQHRSCSDPAEKKRLYAEIDQLSFQAAKFAAANEYDKMVSAIGAKDTNAYTWVEQTVYVNDIPTNELERWFLLEAERFRRPVLRLFHTELETVFEEYNISQDKDFRKTLKAMQAILTPSHPYGTQTTLGRGEDLKNPSQTNIYRFFDQYYVPNNMAIVLCGDFDPEQAVELAKKYFGGLKAKPIPPFTFEPQPDLAQRTLVEVFGNEAPWVEMAWRMPGAASPELDLLPILSALLYNGEAGLIDEHLLHQQQLLEAYAYPRSYEDYGSLYLYGKPREGQLHSEVEQLLWQQVERLRKGDFPDWLIEAVVKNLKLHESRHFEKNEGRAGALSAAYILGLEWGDLIRRWKKWETITKQEIVEMATSLLRPDNYGVVYKHCAPDNTVMKVEKPTITPVELNRVDTSSFGEAFLSRQTPDIDPHFLEFNKVIKTAELAPKIKLRAVPQAKRPTFRLDYCFDMGRVSDRRLGVLEAYLPFLGTAKRSATELRQQFFRLGLQFFATCRDEHFYLSLSGLPESLLPGLELMEEVLASALPDQAALDNLVADILLKRDNDKKEKRSVLFKAMLNEARYGASSPFKHRFSKEELLQLKAEVLTTLLSELRGIQHEVYYTGPHPFSEVKKVLKEKHVVLESVQPPIPAQRFKEKATLQNQVIFVDFPTVQVELLLYSKGTSRFNLEEYLFSQWYNQYFGYGLSSIVYQEIREARALAYSAYCYAANPSHKKRSHYLQAYVGTQPDKLKEAVEAFRGILEEMPVSSSQLAHARTSVLKQLAADRIAPAEIYWTWRSNRDKGFNEDLRKRVFQFLQEATPEDLLNYQKNYVKGRKYTWLVLGERSRVDFDYLRTIGKVKEMTIEDVFGY
ncbi:MAG: M16 family metallopeptidase [Chitinophagales bacterium]|jgi:predicted Zn-dependent peptidase